MRSFERQRLPSICFQNGCRNGTQDRHRKSEIREDVFLQINSLPGMEFSPLHAEKALLYILHWPQDAFNVCEPSCWSFSTCSTRRNIVVRYGLVTLCKTCRKLKCTAQGCFHGMRFQLAIFWRRRLLRRSSGFVPEPNTKDDNQNRNTASLFQAVILSYFWLRIFLSFLRRHKLTLNILPISLKVGVG